MNFTGTDFDDPTPFGGFGKFKSSNAFNRAGKTAVKTQELENQLAGDGIEGRAKLRAAQFRKELAEETGYFPGMGTPMQSSVGGDPLANALSGVNSLAKAAAPLFNGRSSGATGSGFSNGPWSSFGSYDPGFDTSFFGGADLGSSFGSTGPWGDFGGGNFDFSTSLNIA